MTLLDPWDTRLGALTYSPAESAIWEAFIEPPGNVRHRLKSEPPEDRTVPFGYVSENEVFVLYLQGGVFIYEKYDLSEIDIFVS